MKLSRAVLATLRYSDYFSFPLTFSEIYPRLISSPVDPTKLKAQLKLMVANRSLAKTDRYYHLPGKQNLVKLRARRATLSAPLYARARSLAPTLGRFPGVLAVYLTGSLAMQNITANSDIDFMIVTNRGMLWTTRLLLTLYTSLIGLRRTPKSRHHAGKLCLNLYLTPDSFLLPASKRNLYTAYELIQAMPLYDPSHTHAALLATNTWLAKYLPNYSLTKSSKTNFSPPTPLERFIEFFAFRLQYLYMKPKLTRELITVNSAFFHPSNPGTKAIQILSL